MPWVWYANLDITRNCLLTHQPPLQLLFYLGPPCAYRYGGFICWAVGHEGGNLQLLAQHFDAAAAKLRTPVRGTVRSKAEIHKDVLAAHNYLFVLRVVFKRLLQTSPAADVLELFSPRGGSPPPPPPMRYLHEGDIADERTDPFLAALDATDLFSRQHIKPGLPHTLDTMHTTDLINSSVSEIIREPAIGPATTCFEHLLDAVMDILCLRVR